MKKTAASIAVLGALLALPLGANAITYEFAALLNGASEVPTTTTTATGVAFLTYDTKNTATLADDTYDFTMSASGLNGAATGFHIHSAASTTETAPVRIDMIALPAIFNALNTGNGVLLVGATGVSAPTLIAATPASATNKGYAAMSFLDTLLGGLAYVNIHTAANPSGLIRGQLLQVNAVPEPSTYAMLLAGLGALGVATAKRRSRG